MAQQSLHDAVNQSLSADAPSSVGVTATHSTLSAARAAGEKPLSNNTDSEAKPDIADHGDVNGLSSSKTPSQELYRGSDPTAVNPSSTATQDDGAGSRLNDGGSEDDASKGAKGEESVGSDTDTSKPDAITGEAKDSTPRFAPKKAAGFKPVSVTKNFLAKAGSVSIPSKPAGEKSPATPTGSPVPSTQPTPRPRLVAKSVSGQRGSLPQAMSTVARNGRTNGPDPSQVWNKNMTQAPQAIPKQLTDEELRQQYGIQLASRPIEDGDSNQAKWADIDDEDDWAPETIEWNDGTKVNLAETAAAAAAAAEADTVNSQTPPAQEDKPPASAEVADSVVKPTSIGPNATVLKLGSGSQHKPSNSISKSSQEKPSLVSKPAALVPAKSPWAPLPAIDKVSPVQVNHPAQLAQSKFGQRDPHGFDSMPPPPAMHAKEIEADDFSRFSRDLSNGVPRELYVPHSGRYEPVKDNRRQPVRNDGNYRQPSVLQRPSQNEREVDGPPGPSPAFQTNRSQQDPGPWARRRASSGVSTDGNRFGRRMSIGRNYEGARPNAENFPRRGSQMEPEHQRESSPTRSHGMSITSQSPTVSAAPENQQLISAPDASESTADAPTTAPDAAPGEDPVTMQKRLMREKREAAIKRRKEEEEKAEAEKRERIRIKMEQLGMSMDAKPEKKENDAKADAQQQKHAQEESAGRPPAPEPATTRLTSPPKPPAPSATGEPQQYGLMKVHAPQPANVTSPRTSGVLPSKAPALAANRQESSNAAKSDPKLRLPNGDLSRHAAEDQVKAKSEAMAAEPAGLQTWSGSHQQPPSSGLTGWSANTRGAPPASSGNLWGPPSNHRALGNGDFQNNLARPGLQASQQPYPVSNAPAAPQPIGTPRQHPTNRNIAAPGKPDMFTGNLIDDLQHIPSLSSPDPTSHHNAGGRPEGRGPPRPNHEHSSLLNNVPTGPAMPHIEAPQKGLAAWANFSASNGRLEAEQAAREQASRLADPAAGRPRTEDQLPVLQETWKQVSRGAEPGQRHIIGSTQVTSNYAPSAASQPHVDFHHRGTGVGTRSRFKDIFEHQKGAAGHATVPRPPSPSIPPPESIEHPAYVGGDDRPLVNLPGSKQKAPEAHEKPVVKLPPAKDYARSSPQPPPAPSHAQSWSGIVKQTTVNQVWQDRINGLWAHKSAPSPAVQTASKPRFDIHPLDSSLSISLPPHLAKTNTNAVAKTVEEEEALFEEEREFGSIPTTSIPDIPADHPAWTPAPRPDWKDRRFRPLREDTIFSVMPNSSITGEDTRGSITVVTVMISGMADAITKTLSRDATQSARRGNRQLGRRHGFRNVKSRDVSHGSVASANGGEGAPAKEPVASGTRTGASRGFKNHRSFRGSRSASSSIPAKN